MCFTMIVSMYRHGSAQVNSAADIILTVCRYRFNLLSEILGLTCKAAAN